MFSQNELWMGEGTLGYKLDFLILETTTQATVTIYLSTTFEGHRDTLSGSFGLEIR